MSVIEKKMEKMAPKEKRETEQFLKEQKEILCMKQESDKHVREVQDENVFRLNYFKGQEVKVEKSVF
jgi:hypothetical protein